MPTNPCTSSAFLSSKFKYPHHVLSTLSSSSIPSFAYYAHKLKMGLKLVSLPLLFAMFAALAMYTHVSIPNRSKFVKHLIGLSLRTFSSSPFDSAPMVFSAQDSHLHRHKHHEDGDTGSICDDFPPDFPPPDTNTTSILCVDRRGCCNFTAVQAAVDAVGALSQKRTIIWINSGVYYEKVIVPKNKTNITFQGQGFASTAIVWNDTANSSHGTSFSASVQVFSVNFIAKNISFMNVAPIPKPGDMGAQAVAIRVAGDQAAFWGCGFFGAQDTLHDDKGRHYFKDCYIQGSIDFIFGDARSFYQNCQLISMANPVPPGSRSVNGALTAHGRVSVDENTGFAFVDCNVGGNGRVWLGRAWRPFSRVVFAYTFLSDIIASEGWNDFNDPTRDQSTFYGEYMCSGPGANTSMRVPYAQKLNDTRASIFLNASFIDADQWLQPFDA